jgi:hypothetical protein
MEPPEGREIVADSEWETIYRTSSGELRFVSKFLVAGFLLSAKDLIHRWGSLSADQKYEFARAYSAKSVITAYSGRSRSAFRRDVDHDSGLKPISVPG